MFLVILAHICAQRFVLTWSQRLSQKEVLSLLKNVCSFFSNYQCYMHVHIAHSKEWVLADNQEEKIFEEQQACVKRVPKQKMLPTFSFLRVVLSNRAFGGRVCNSPSIELLMTPFQTSFMTPFTERKHFSPNRRGVTFLSMLFAKAKYEWSFKSFFLLVPQQLIFAYLMN